jgi:hypothetical protein
MVPNPIFGVQGPRQLSARSTSLYGSSNPLAFMDLQDVQELSNFFERRVAYQVGVTGDISFADDF